jgi:hypothetical protein
LKLSQTICTNPNPPVAVHERANNNDNDDNSDNTTTTATTTVTQTTRCNMMDIDEDEILRNIAAGGSMD